MRPVEAELAPEGLLHGGVDRLGHHDVDRVTRREVKQQEHAGRDEEQDGDRRAQPAQNETAHHARVAARRGLRPATRP